MKLPKLSRSRSNSPPSSTPATPNGSNNLSPTTSERKSTHLCFPRSPLSRSRKQDFSSEIVEVPTPSSSKCVGANASSASRSPSLADHDGRRSSSSSKYGKAKAALRRVPSSIMQEIRQVFAQFDTNGDGKISADELSAVLRSLGDEATREEAVLMVGEVDADGDGFIDLQEFVDLNTSCLHVTGEMASHEELTAAFDIFDLDKNGRITAEELHKVLANLGDQHSTFEDCKRMIRGVDRKGAGHVDFDDFKRMMTPSIQH